MVTEKNQEKQDSTTELPQGLLTGEVSEDMHPLLLWLTKNIKTLSIVCLALILVFGGVAAYEYFQKQSHITAANELGKILVTTDDAKKLETLERYVKTAPSSMEIRGLFELAATSINDKKFADAGTAWTQLTGKVDASLQTIPALGRVQALAMEGNNAEAIVILKDLQKNGPKAYAVSVNSTLGALAEQAGDYAAARDAYKALLASSSGQSRTKAFFEHKILQLSEKAGKEKS